MRITYELTEREKDFLAALKDKEHPKFAYSGRMSDDKFRKEWKDEIDIFSDNGLFEKVNRGHDSYWEYKLTDKAMKLFDRIIK